MPEQTGVKAEGGMTVPRHVAIIMDGNGRWAKNRGLPRVMGHRAGAKAVRRIVEEAARRGIRILTLFAFSSENWKRPKLEVTALMQLFARALDSQTPDLKKNGISLRVIGDTSGFPEALQKKIRQAEAETADGARMRLNVAAGYGGRWDIARAAQKLAQKAREGALAPEDINEELLGRELAEPSDVDLLIRTGGERRVSNFLIWQASYSELWFSDILWPDFTGEDLDAALKYFKGRERRFGMISEQLQTPL
jgi:undecaprenyl diphosphate synthase